MDTMDMVIERGLLMQKLPLLLKLNLDMDMAMDMVTMATEAMDTMAMERGLLLPNLAMDMVMDMVIMDMVTMDMEAMVMDMATMDTMDNIYRRSLFQIFYHC